MNSLVRDIRYALRSLRQSPGFTAVAVTILALGIGANTTMFSVVYGLLLRPLPYPRPDEIVQLAQRAPEGTEEMAVTYRHFQFLAERSDALAEIAATTSVGFNLFTGDASERVSGLRVSRDYFRVLGVAPTMGREFLPDEDQRNGAPVVILSHDLWRRRFAADPAIVGRVVRLDGEPYTVVGVMPADFVSIPDVDVWSTLAQVGRTIGSGQNLLLLGRLRPGTLLAATQARLEPVFADFLREFSTSTPRNVAVTLVPYHDLIAEGFTRPVRLLFGAIGFVLLIACANVANLLLGRATARGRELAVRVALGAGRWQLMRQLLTESLLLALFGGALGVVLAQWGVQAVLALVPGSLAHVGAIRLDGWVLAFTLAASLFTGLLFGVLPAWHAGKTHVGDALREGTLRTTGSRRQERLRGALVVGEIALSLVLLVGAGLLLRTFGKLVNTDPGFDARGLVAAEIWLTGSRYDSAGAITPFYQEIEDRVARLPGVQGTAVVEAGIPLQRGGNMPVSANGEPINSAVEYRTVTPGYLGLLGVPVLQGRGLLAADRAGAEPVALVNQAFVRRYFADTVALDRTVQLGRADAVRRIVGVVGDMRSFVGLPGRPAVFLPSAQTPRAFTNLFGSWFPIHVVARVNGDPDLLRAGLPRAIQSVDPRVPVGRIRTMDDVLQGSLAYQRFMTALLGVFAALALVLAAAGIYGVMSYFTTQRTHEIGVRVALGALPGDVLGLVLRRGVVLTGLGVIVGLIGARALARLLNDPVYGITVSDPLTFAAVATALVLLALAATAIPALRATRLDPVEALRHE